MRNSSLLRILLQWRIRERDETGGERIRERRWVQIRFIAYFSSRRLLLPAQPPSHLSLLGILCILYIHLPYATIKSTLVSFRKDHSKANTQNSFLASPTHCTALPQGRKPIWYECVVFSVFVHLSGSTYCKKKKRPTRKRVTGLSTIRPRVIMTMSFASIPHLAMQCDVIRYDAMLTVHVAPD